MIRLQIPFLLTDLNQFSSDLLEKDIHFEGSIFDGNDLRNDLVWKKIKKNLSFIRNTYGNVIHSLHYPMDNANYLEDKISKNNLYKYIELAQQNEICTIVLHSNCIQSLTEYDARKLDVIRAKYLLFFSELNEFLKDGRMMVGIENMPIIGDKGEDFDSVFVLPSDFGDINYSNIGITWDFGHWAYTHLVLSNLSNFSQAIKVNSTNFKDYIDLKSQIIHTHFSSFIGTTYPHSGSICREGAGPSTGTPDHLLLENAVKEVQSWEKPLAMTLEIQEVDYTNRVNVIQVIDWIKSILQI